jgi:trehalose utilization protein
VINVTVWNEYSHHQKEGDIIEAYPDTMHNAIRDFLKTDDEINVKTAVLQDEEQGLSQEVLDNTDVLIYWAHCLHNEVTYETAARVRDSVQKGMGVIFLHSAHLAKPFQ